MLFSVNVYGLSITYENDEGKSVKINDFLDTQGHWAHDTIWKVADYGLIVGSNGNFMPDQPIKRGDLAIIIDRMLGLKAMSYNYFNDLYNDSYYANSLLRCVAAEYITGVDANEIDPEGFATREQVAVILSRMFDFNSNNYSSSTSFKDDNKISSWARSSVSAMSKLGYINGTDTGYVNPQSYITRAELVTLLNNIANTYIPKKANANLDSTSEYKNEFPTNVIVSRNITLRDSTINRDLILTPNTGSIILNNTLVKGRLLLMSNQSVSLKNANINQIVLLGGKASINGMNENVYSVRVTASASESTLDNIPKVLILDSGVRVNVNGVMYENESTRTKTYYASDLQADISDEQGYIIGGPKISGVKFEQDMDNTITVSNVRITAGENDIREIGVIWLEQEDDENTKNPTYKKNDGRKIYRSDKIDEVIEFEVGEVEGTCAYRVYVKDKDGLFAYSNSTIFSEYEYSTTLKIYDNNYPENVDVEVVFRGDSVPEISSIRVVYDIDELYSENHKDITLKLYSDPDAEYQPDSTKYKRYTGTIKCDTQKIDGETVYTPPTAFGYIITFKNGTLINRFPILTNAVPEGVSPMANLETGSAEYSGSTTLNIKNNKITTRYIVPQEIGVVYKTSISESISRPTAGASGWERKASYVNLDVNESETFNVSIPLTSKEGYTYYCAYVKTSNGYWYGSVKKFANDVQGDEDGPKLNGSIEANVISPTTVFIPFTYTATNTLYNNENDFIVSIFKNNSVDAEWQLNQYDFFEVKTYSSGKVGYILIDGLDEKSEYQIDLQLKDAYNLKSNKSSIVFNTSDYRKFKLNNKTILNENAVKYIVDTPTSDYTIISVEAVNAPDVSINRSLSDNSITIGNVDLSNLENVKLKINYRVSLSVSSNNKLFVCSQIVDLY